MILRVHAAPTDSKDLDIEPLLGMKAKNNIPKLSSFEFFMFTALNFYGEFIKISDCQNEKENFLCYLH